MPLLLMLWCNVVKRNHYINANGITYVVQAQPRKWFSDYFFFILV